MGLFILGGYGTGASLLQKSIFMQGIVNGDAPYSYSYSQTHQQTREAELSQRESPPGNKMSKFDDLLFATDPHKHSIVREF
ncbi:hypothetical protein C7B69_11650 [filamentous cyanobacterium Phorm 46]|nr:hypothetical protein C7B69_11650 [filamentous cyanobacterium Phorm 46]